jgi:thiol-disulfide isomerase/thioredoxin
VSTGLWVALGAVVAAMVFGLWRLISDGRFRQPTASVESASLLAGTPWAGALGERATFVQFSSAFCAPCRATRRVLSEVVAGTEGVAHVEIDAELHLDVVRRLGILRTPTTLVLDPGGRELGRAVGAPTRDQVLGSLPASLT